MNDNFSTIAQSDAVLAESTGKPIIGILIGNPAQVPLILVQRRLVDFTGDFAEALRALVSLIPLSAKQNKSIVVEQPKSKGYVFLSYAQEDSDFVDKLCEYLKKRGYGFWDYRSSDRNYHTFLFLELEDAISNSAATLSILSPDWKKSVWTPKEMFFAQDVKVPVFLLMAREMGRS